MQQASQSQEEEEEESRYRPPSASSPLTAAELAGEELTVSLPALASVMSEVVAVVANKKHV